LQFNSKIEINPLGKNAMSEQTFRWDKCNRKIVSFFLYCHKYPFSIIQFSIFQVSEGFWPNS